MNYRGKSLELGRETAYNVFSPGLRRNGSKSYITCLSGMFSSFTKPEGTEANHLFEHIKG